jgi:hypothetical protein
MVRPHAASLVRHTGNRVSKSRAGRYRRRPETCSSEWEGSEASIRGAARIAHSVPGNWAGKDICKQSSRMTLAIEDLIGAPSAISGRLLIAARGRLTAFRAVGGRKGLS